jgi:hypothetical protein
MQTFQTAAVVGLIDNMSGPLKTLAAQAKQLAKTIEAGKLDPSGTQAYAASLRQANAQAKEHLGVVRSIHAMWKSVGGIAAGVAASKITHKSIDAIKDYAPYESTVRYQRAIGDFGPADTARLDKQRQDAVNKWGMKLQDTAEAQQVFVTRNFSAPITESATKAAIILGRAMNTSAAEAGKMLEGTVFGQGIHLKDPATASRETMRAADMAAIAAKKGAMTPEDIKQLAIYGMAPATAAGLTPEQVFATGMTFKRANIDGTQAGTFLRAASSRLMAPTTMGRDALSLMLARQGKTLDDFTGGADLSPEAIDKALKQNGRGRSLGPKGIASLQKAIDEGEDSDDPNKDVFGSRAAFNSAARKALEDSGQKFDKGEVPKIVAHMQRLRDIAMQKIKASELFDNILQNATPQEKIKFFGDKQGGRAGSLNFEQYQEYLHSQQSGTGFAEKIAEERMQGFAASLGRLESAIDATSKRLVEANQGWLTKLMNAGADSANWVSNLSETSKQALTAAGALATLAGAVTGAKAAFNLYNGLKGGAAGVPPELPVMPKVPELPKAHPTQLDLFPETLAKTAKPVSKAMRLFEAANVIGLAVTAYQEAGELYDATLGNGSESERDIDSLTSAYKQMRLGNKKFGKPRPFVSGLNPDSYGVRGTQSSGWQDSAVTSWKPPSEDGNKKWGDPKAPQKIEVSGTVVGNAELHNNMTLTLQPSAYFESLVKRAESVATMSLNGRARHQHARARRQRHQAEPERTHGGPMTCICIDDLRPASFRGVEFFVTSDKGEYGRRDVIHEYPMRDDPYIEDMGKKATKFHVSGYLFGDDWVAQKDALVAACTARGPAILQLPTEAPVMVACPSLSVSRSKDECGFYSSRWSSSSRTTSVFRLRSA